MGGEFRRGAAGGGIGQRVVDVGRQGEGRVGGEHGGEAGALHRAAILRPGDRAVLRVRAVQGAGELGQGGVVGGHVGAADIGADAVRAVPEGGIAQGPDQVLDRVLGQGAGVDLAGDREADGQDGIAERIFRRPLHRARGEGQQFLHQIGGQSAGGLRDGIGCCIGHGRKHARFFALAARASLLTTGLN